MEQKFLFVIREKYQPPVSSQLQIPSLDLNQVNYIV